eukprot:scaffold323070_cov21-Tisochrysis_lutea.AAC.2
MEVASSGLCSNVRYLIGLVLKCAVDYLWPSVRASAMCSNVRRHRGCAHSLACSLWPVLLHARSQRDTQCAGGEYGVQNKSLCAPVLAWQKA